LRDRESPRTTRGVRYLAICVALVACKHEQREPIGKRIEPPAGLRLGMTAVEAKAAMPELGEGIGGAGSAGGDSPGAFLAGDAQLIANMRDGKIAQLIVAFDPDHVPSKKLEGMLVDRWGVPEAVRGPFGPQLEWKSTDTGWRARLSSDATLPRVEFTPYRPVTAAFFGSKVAPLGTLAKLRIGMTYDEAKAALPELPAESPIVTFDGGGDDLVGRAFFRDHKISVMWLDLPSLPEAKKLVAAAWGAGTPNESGALVWSDPTTGWRAELVRVESHGSAGTTESAALQVVPLAR
jgi:hypothetical protein